MSQYFSKPFRSFGGNINVKVNLSNHATKADIKNISHADTSSLALKTNLANLKSEVDKFNIDKLVPVPVDLSKLSDVVRNDVVKKDVYDKLVTKVDNIDTSGLVLKIKYDIDKSELENKIPDNGSFVKKTDYNTKITKIEGKIPDINNLATKTALTTVENKIPNVNNLVKKKTDYNTKVTENKLNNHNHDKYIDTSEFNRLVVDVFNARLAQANLVTKTDFDAKLSGLNRKITQNKTKHLLVENELNKLKTSDSSNYNSKSYFEVDGTPNYLMFQPLSKYFKVGDGNLHYVLSWTSKGLSNESIKPSRTSNNILTPILHYRGTKTKVSFSRACLQQGKVTFNHGKVVNIYIVHRIIKAANINIRNNNLTVQNALFGEVSLTKNADVNKYKYSGYGIAFDRTSSFHFQVVEMVKM